MEEPVNPLLYVLGYGAGFVAQGTPADMPGLAALIEEGVRFPGFAFINIRSPCVTYGEPEAQLKIHKKVMKRLSAMGHDPSDRIRAMDLAQHYGTELHTGVFYRNPTPPPSYEKLARERQEQLRGAARSKEKIVDMFIPE